ncbi:hypothetical protein NPIL_497291 [Nephila pilipes]|uniref:Uncharacterized protein n=1 Tax=Nephila pilipes TaxID=299642 RepID=A0A8X6PSQ0_NEPPI|nr:hypothetical protein NPIL_497291 [Nephila pilipes]
MLPRPPSDEYRFCYMLTAAMDLSQHSAFVPVLDVWKLVGPVISIRPQRRAWKWHLSYSDLTDEMPEVFIISIGQ